MDIQTAVNESLDNAKDDGFFEPGASLHCADVHAIAEDLAEYDATFYGFDPVQLVPAIEKWLTANDICVDAGQPSGDIDRSIT